MRLHLKGLRKWTVMVLLLAASAIFRAFDLLTGAEFVDLVKPTVIAFVSANLGEHVLNVVGKKIGSGE